MMPIYHVLIFKNYQSLHAYCLIDDWYIKTKKKLTKNATKFKRINSKTDKDIFYTRNIYEVHQ